jgi:tetratricopeptide (TPR) repeat protein
VLAAVTFRLTTPDFWQHLVVGKAIWQLGRIPQEHLWTWPSHGNLEVLPSWGFRWLLWPFWEAGGFAGLQAWRWLTTLAAFALAWATARRLGARGMTPLVVIAVAVLSYRIRAQVRPETLVAVLLALQLWLLERRRERGGGGVALVLVAWAWANVHISWFVGPALLAIHGLARPAGARDVPPPAGMRGMFERLDRMSWPALVAAAAAISFANPYGWRALAQPLEYFLTWRHEPIYRTIPELTPLWVTWRATLASGLPVLLVLWPLLVAVRALRLRFDVIEALTCVLFTALALFNQRFIGFLMVAIVPYLSRDLAELAAARPFRAWRAPWARAAVAIGVMALASLPSWRDTRFRFGVGIVPTLVPGAACDFLAARGISGRMFNPFYFGGYVAWRFWPDRARLPFMDIHQTGTRRDRDLYAYAFASRDAWDALQRAHDFQVALLDGHQEWVRGDRLLDFLDQDPRWALVFRDDAAALYVRRDGPLAGIANAHAYRVMPGGQEGMARVAPQVFADPVSRRALRAELERRAAASPLNAQARSLLANLDYIEGNRAGARTHLEAALAVDPTLAGVHRRLAWLHLDESRWREGIRELAAERRLGTPPEDDWVRMGAAWEKLGDDARAVKAYRRALAVHAMDADALAALRRLGADR